VRRRRDGHIVCGLNRSTLSTMEGAMSDNRREENDRSADRLADRSRDTERDQREERDELARRREQSRQAQMTNREREERWPIG
jgi:hypothetical protein